MHRLGPEEFIKLYSHPSPLVIEQDMDKDLHEVGLTCNSHGQVPRGPVACPMNESRTLLGREHGAQVHKPIQPCRGLHYDESVQCNGEG